MDVATMVAINNLNMVTVMAVQAANNVITIVNGERMEEDMDGLTEIWYGILLLIINRMNKNSCFEKSQK